MAKEQLTPEQKAVLENLMDTIGEEIDVMRDLGPISREFSLVLTKLEEAEMWGHRAFEELGYEIGDDDEDSDDAPDDDEDSDDDDEDDAADEPSDEPSDKK